MTNEEKIDKVKEIIRKCLALSSSPNEHEASLAMERAQELLLKYNLSEADVAAKEGRGSPEMVEERFDIMGRFLWRKDLVHTVAIHNFCTTYVFMGRGARDTVVIVGRQTNVTGVKEMVSWLLPQMERLITRESIEWEGKATSRNSFRTSFAYGMLHRLARRLGEDRLSAQENSNTKAIVVRMDTELVEHMRTRHSRMTPTKGPSIQSDSAYVEGIRAGDKVSLKNYTKLTQGG